MIGTQRAAPVAQERNRSFNPSDGLGVIGTFAQCFGNRTIECFNPSDGLGVIGTAALYWVQSYTDRVSIPRMGWG